MNDIEKIRTEINRRLNYFEAEKYKTEALFDKLNLDARIAALEDLVAFIDSLSEEKTYTNN